MGRSQYSLFSLLIRIAEVLRVAFESRNAQTLKNGSKIKRSLRDSTPHTPREGGSGAPRKNRTLETRRWAQSIPDVAFAGHRESVAEARPRCGRGGRLPVS